MRPCLTDGMAAAGHNQSFPRAIISAPSKYYGLNLTDMYTKQGIQHLLAILQYGHSLDDLTGQLIRGSLETMTLELRSPQNPFTQDYTEMHSLVTNLWIKTAWQFQYHHTIRIKTDLPKLTIVQTNDQFLIQSFQHVGLKGAVLVTVNHCRLYLQLTTLADICDGSGLYIPPDMWASQPNTMFTTGFHWPNQGRPPKKDWIQWQLAIWQAFPVTHLLGLDQPLGEWLQLPTQSSHHWHWLTSFSTQKLYHWTRQWQLHDWHQGHSNQNPKYKKHVSGKTQLLPPDCKQVTIKTAATYLTPTLRVGHTIPYLQEPATWKEFIATLMNKQKQTFHNLNLIEDGNLIVKAIMGGIWSQ